jgi:hypothetical protein
MGCGCGGCKESTPDTVASDTSASGESEWVGMDGCAGKRGGELGAQGDQ